MDEDKSKGKKDQKEAQVFQKDGICRPCGVDVYCIRGARCQADTLSTS